MKNLLMAAIVLASLQSHGAASNVASKCVVKNYISGSNSGIKGMTDINSNLGNSYNTQELVFEDFQVVFTNATRILDLTKNDKNIASVQASSLRSGEVITLIAFDSQTGQPTAELSCKLFF